MDHATPPGGGAREAHQPPGYQRGEAWASHPADPREGVAGLGNRTCVLGEGSPKGLPEPAPHSEGRYVVAWGLQRFSRWFPRWAWVNLARRFKIVGNGSHVDSGTKQFLEPLRTTFGDLGSGEAVS